MLIISHQQINIICFIVLLLFLVYTHSVLNKKANLNKIYVASLSLNLILVTLEIAFDFIINIENISVFLPRIIGGAIFVLSPIVAYLFLKFVCFYFSTTIKIKKSVKISFAVLFIINSIFAILSFKSKILIESASIVNSFLPFLISLFFLLYSIFVIIKNKKRLIRFEYIYIITISLITSTLVLFQILANEFRFIWCGTAFTLILMFILIQQRELYRDELTGAMNRLVLKKCLDAHVKKPVGNLSIVMIDLDYFKGINDTYGHSEGDHVLKTFVRLLQKVYSENGIVIRMGGDEFLILIYKVTVLELNELVNKMRKMVDRYNNKGTKSYRIKYSCASGTYDNSNISIDQFIHEIDIKMYQNKKDRKGKMWSVENL